jgi:two-component system LytT family response regulator
MQTEAIILKNRNKYQKVYLSDILYCKTNGNYTKVITKREEFSIAKPLKLYETELAKNGFYRINRNYLINLQHCTEIEINGKTAHAFLENGEKIKISVRRVSRAINLFQKPKF